MVNYLFQELCDMIRYFASCMDDYLYVYDIKDDIYFISEKAVDRFRLPSNCFHDVPEQHRLFVHPDDYEMLIQDLTQISSGAREEHNLHYRWMGKDGAPIWINCRGRLLRDEQEQPAFMVGCINEIGMSQKADNVSGLLGEASFRNRMKRFGTQSIKGFVLRIGIDDFSDINEKFGVEYGDHILKTVASCIDSKLKPHQRAYRMVGDEFLVEDFCGGSEENAIDLYDAIRQELDHCIQMSGYEAVYTISAGIVGSESTRVDGYRELMKYSRFALSEAKKTGKNRACCFSREQYKKFLRKRELLRSFRESVASGYQGFEVYFQPIMDVQEERLYAAEALLRFRDKEGNEISPAEAVPILEESGLIIPVGKWVIQNALALCRECRRYLPDFRVSINLSYVQILKSPMMAELKLLIEESGIGSEGIVMELTESGYLEETPAVRNVWTGMRTMGIRIALDDFGSGYSNLMNIGRLKPDVVKLDRNFTVKALTRPYEYQLMQHVIQMVHKLDLYVCVEGIENQEELQKISRLEPDLIQGFYYGKPCQKETFMKSFAK